MPMSASPAAGGSIVDPVRALQHALYWAAKADPGRRFHALRDKVFRRDVLWRAWVAVHRNDGAPGIDNTTLADVKQCGVTRLLEELATELRDGSYRPLASRRVFIPKPGTAEQRPSGSARSVRRTTPSKSSSMRHGGAGGGWWRRISLAAFRRFRTTS